MNDKWTMRRILAIAIACAGWVSAAAAGRPPNVVLVMTDDQGYGDLSFHGNPKLRTPHLDRLAAESARFRQFYVCPVCSPTRASLMTGRYNYRTGAIDTYLGRSMMAADEVTLAEMLASAGYRTGIFGKWHLGDNYPLRAIDQGFAEALVHRGGGIGQPADPPGNRYFDPVLEHNGQSIQAEGYCSDVFTDAAIRFIRAQNQRPFFVYLSYNCPHTPLQVPDSYLARFREMNLAHDQFPDVGYPLQGKADQGAIARVYGMVANIDDNMGRLLAALDELGLRDETIVIFLTDNGPQQVRYKAGLRGRKGQVYEGGIRVPCFVRWPKRLEPRELEPMAAHIDIVPTLLAACGVKPPEGVRLDGVNLLPLLEGDVRNLPDRELFFQWHRGDQPQLHRAFAARGPRYKLVQAGGAGAQPLPAEPRFELFDIKNDPYEMHDLAAQEPEIVERLRKRYEAWFADVGRTRGYAPPRIHLGTPHESPVILTRQDWRGPQASWGAEGLGYWEVHVARAGAYRITLRFDAPPAAAEAHLKIGGDSHTQAAAAGATQCVFETVRLAEGPTRLEAWIARGEKNVGVRYVEVERVE